MNPTDPMTPVRALIEAAGKATPGPWRLYGRSGDQVIESESSIVLCDDAESSNMEDAERDLPFIVAARNATASISQLLSEHDKVVAYIAELRAHPEGIYRPLWAAEKLESIQEGK